MDKIVKYVHVVKNDGYRRLIVLYTDETWEEIFQFNRNIKLDGKLFLRKTRYEIFDILRRVYNQNPTCLIIKEA